MTTDPYKTFFTRPKRIRMVAGCMTGSSIDGLDVALVRINGNGFEMKASVLQCYSHPLAPLDESLRRLAERQPMSASEIAKLAYELAQLHVKALKDLLHNEKVDLIALHGQTVFHSPPLSWQLINPAPIAYGFHTPVVYNMRAADLALGGQGAPITPIADFMLFRCAGERRCVANLGGFCNITRIPGDSGVLPDQDQLVGWISGVTGKDVCSCNQLLDRIARELFHVPFDNNGAFAAEGRVQEQPFKELSSLLGAQAGRIRSLGTGDELNDWVEKYRTNISPHDLARTACAAIAAIIALPGPLDRRILTGGGVKNKTLVAEIRARSNKLVSISDDLDVPATYREAVGMAILGALCQDRIPITLSRITGVIPPPISGCWVLP